MFHDKISYHKTLNFTDSLSLRIFVIAEYDTAVSEIDRIDVYGTLNFIHI